MKIIVNPMRIWKHGKFVIPWNQVPYRRDAALWACIRVLRGEAILRHIPFLHIHQYLCYG